MPTSEEGPRAYGSQRKDGVLCVTRAGTEWLSTGWNGGRIRDDRAFNISVPEGWSTRDLEGYVLERLSGAGFCDSNAGSVTAPVLLTGVDLSHARGATCGPVTVYATAGVSNPAALPMEPRDGSLSDPGVTHDEPETPGTVNLIVGTTCRLDPGAFENLLAVVAEAKARTLLARTGFPGTTTDAIVIGHDPDARSRPYSGSATRVGAATRAAVRDALCAAVDARYDAGDATLPESVADATYGCRTDVRSTVFRP